ncbi:type II toxin-antitoxin system Phd/YefM family antitoxin [filamentous cyanobacterium LEGE 11480]|uniref:Type II toxin-antitoxin system Phd/YefM family antitoxin n=1 Tax=Romeriopsis navalis LEGE 11480 TaxID=2777977 RepID=A0A928VN38_9CYAN|nr:hypothetical protein [Romeriopsis navalis]MBE9030657.1 type II toxin-antitoxin system Phd/YefM family antitoxin [Romeriopsis navalis LEGE 11480]
MRAIETLGTLDAQGHIQLDNPQPQAKRSRVRIIMLLDEENNVDQGQPASPITQDPIQISAQPRIPGQDSGKVTIADDFNAPLPETVLNDFLNPL